MKNYKKTIVLIAYAIIILNSQKINAQWNYDLSLNNPISLAANDQQDARLVSDGDKGAIITWVDYRSNVTVADIFVQRIDKNGYIKWAVNGLPICTSNNDQKEVNITEADNGSAIVVWSDSRNGFEKDVYAQKIDSNGTILWAANGVSLSTLASTKQNPKVLHDGNGGAIVTWQDSSVASNDFDIKAQHVDMNGVITWSTTGENICAFTNKQINPRLETDNANGAIITWQDKRFNNFYDIYVQHITAAGAVAWTANGFIICNANEGQLNPKIEPDGSGGAIIAWQDKRNNNYDVYAQRIDNTGALQWVPNGVAVCNAFGAQSAVDLKYIPGSRCMGAWKDNRNPLSYDIYMQMLNLNGTAQWANNGVFLSTGINPNIAYDGVSGGIITWQDSITGTWNVYANRVNTSGTALWGNSVLLCSAADDQQSPKNISDMTGGGIFVWQDGRNGNDLDIHCTHIDSNYVTSITENNSNSFALSLYPNPVSDFLLINNLENQKIKSVTITNALGKIIYQNTFSKIESLIKIDTKLFPAGVYFLQCSNADDKISLIKFVKE
nr:T9SS type A sorting domain-containing protein [Bacteroidota bacterium]